MSFDLLVPGQLFAGRYRVGRFLASGGFGAVYVAEQLETELTVALKVLGRHVLESRAAVEHFQLEARVASKIRSDHIVKVFDAGFDEGTSLPFLVMELLEGEGLDRLISRGGPLRADRVATYVSQVASALDKAHTHVDRSGKQRPIVHRDLKPENLFLTQRENGEPLVKVLDFGIAKLLSGTTQQSRTVTGTPLYMAFEQAAGERVTPQSDIWTLGLVTFYLLTGRHYWKAGNVAESSMPALFAEVLSLPLVPASLRAREIGSTVSLSAGFDVWFSRCVNRDSGQRFASAGECARELTTALSAMATATPEAAVATLASNDFPGTAPAVSPPGMNRTLADSSYSLLPATPAARAAKRAPSLVMLVAVVAAITLAGVAIVWSRKNSRAEALPAAADSRLAAAPPAAPARSVVAAIGPGSDPAAAQIAPSASSGHTVPASSAAPVIARSAVTAVPATPRTVAASSSSPTTTRDPYEGR